MSEPERRAVQVRVRRSPRIGVFLGIGAVAGVVVALVATLAVPPSGTTSPAQTLGFFALLLAPVGALVTGAFAVVLEARAVRRARLVDAEHERTDVEDPDAH